MHWFSTTYLIIIKVDGFTPAGGAVEDSGFDPQAWRLPEWSLHVLQKLCVVCDKIAELSRMYSALTLLYQLGLNPACDPALRWMDTVTPRQTAVYTGINSSLVFSNSSLHKQPLAMWRHGNMCTVCTAFISWAGTRVSATIDSFYYYTFIY